MNTYKNITYYRTWINGNWHLILPESQTSIQLVDNCSTDDIERIIDNFYHKKIIVKIMTNKIENITENNRNKNIEMIAETLVFSEYAEYYRQRKYKISFIVIHDDGENEYIACLLLNINIFNYYDGSYKNNFSMDYLKEFGLFHHNGYLGVTYDKDYAKTYIIGFFERYGKYFIEDFEKYKCHKPKNLKDHIIKLYDEIIREIELLNKSP